ncbi:MAG: hypothetical protein RR201_02075 [Malacoplasma sp.]
MEDKYVNDKYNKELYIPKGYILPNGAMLTKQYARFHMDMAEKFVHENYHNSFVNDIIKEEREYMLKRLGAIQIMMQGLPLILFCDQHQNNFIQEAIASYLSFGWKEVIIPNEYATHLNFIRNSLECTELFYEGEWKNEKTIGYSKILKR